MRRILVHIVSLYALSNWGFCEEALSIRSGEHDVFSRLVIDQSSPLNWSVESFPDHAVVVLEGVEVRFDTSKVFELIPHSRITAVETDQRENATGLVIRFGCACHAEVFSTPTNRIVVDVKDGAVLAEDDKITETSGAEANPAIPGNLSDQTVSPSSLFVQSAVDLPAVHGRLIASLAETNSAEAQEDGSAQENDDSVTNPESEGANAESDSALSAAVAEAHQALVQQLVRSVDQGLIEYADENEILPDLFKNEEAHPTFHGANNELPPGTNPIREENAIFGVPSETEPTGEVQPAPIEGQFDVQTVLDRDSPQLPTSLDRPGPQCLSDEDFNYEDWADDSPFYEQLANLNSKLLGEFDLPDTAISTALARLYIYHGFGIEAHNVIAQFGAKAEDAALLMDLAAIIEEQKIPADGPIMSNIDCANEGEFWSALAVGAERLNNPEIMDLVLKSFSELPIELRRLTGPRIGMLLLEIDQTSAAEKVFFMISRASGEHGSGFDLFQAKVERESGNTRNATAILEKMINSNSSNRPEALVEYSDLTLEQGLPITDDLITDVAGMATVLDGTQIGRAMRLAEIRLKAGSNELKDALELFQNKVVIENTLSATDTELLVELFLSAQAGPESAEDYAGAILKYSDLILDAPEYRLVRLDVAAKLRTLGLPNEALGFLGSLLDLRDEDARLEAAKCALELSQPEQAIAWLDGKVSEAAEELRLEAYLALGQGPGATTYSTENEKFAWPLGDWQTTANMPKSNFQLLAQFMLDRTTNIAPEFSETSDLQTGQPGNEFDVAKKFLTKPYVPAKITLESTQKLLTDQIAVQAIIDEMMNIPNTSSE